MPIATVRTRLTSPLAGRRPAAPVASCPDRPCSSSCSLPPPSWSLHGLFGPDIAPGNLATVLTWVHYRGLLVVALLAAGNFFCAGCPFVLVRDWGRRLHARAALAEAPARQVDRPRALRRGALRLRALRSVGAAARHGVSGAGLLRRRAGDRSRLQGRDVLQALCPIGQFNFVASTMSPLELRIREAGNVPDVPDLGLHRRAPIAPEAPQPDCPAGLRARAVSAGQGRQHRLHVLPRLRAGVPARQHRARGAHAGPRARSTRAGDPGLAGSAIVRTSRSSSVLFVFGALLNAFAMVAPVHHVEQWLAGTLGSTSDALVLGCLFVLGLGVAPLLLLGTRRWRDADPGWRRGGVDRSSLPCATRTALVPLRLRHVAGALRVSPPDRCADDRARHPERGDRPDGMGGARRATVAMGGDAAGCGVPDSTGMHPARHDGLARRRCTSSLCATIPIGPIRATVPWADRRRSSLAAAAIWILFQPMEMRGMDWPDDIAWPVARFWSSGYDPGRVLAVAAVHGAQRPAVSDRLEPDRRAVRRSRSGPIPTAPTMARRAASSG